MSRASLQADLANAQARTVRLSARIQQLERRSSQEQGGSQLLACLVEDIGRDYGGALAGCRLRLRRPLALGGPGDDDGAACQSRTAHGFLLWLWFGSDSGVKVTPDHG